MKSDHDGAPDPRFMPAATPNVEPAADAAQVVSESLTNSGPPSDHRWLTPKVWAWSLWDWGSAAFNAVITTFVFAVYITNEKYFGPDAETTLGWAMALAGLAIAVFAPIAGQRADRSGRRNRSLAVNTFLVVLASAGLFFVEASPDFLWLGLVLLGLGNVAFEFASVNYYAMLHDVSNKHNVGRVSGFGWGMGYIGGIVLLLLLFIGFINPEVGWFGVTCENGMDVRVSMLFAALWFALFALPVVITMKDASHTDTTAPKESVFTSYRLLWETVKRLWKTDRNTMHFLIASAIFRDGMAGVFAFAGVIAQNVFEFDGGQVIIFAVVANLVAGVATIISGRLDDAVGPKRLIMVSLISMIACGIVIFFFHHVGPIIYWIFGLTLAVFVGPVQSASRTYLSRIIPEGKEGEMFGLYATTGRAVSFLSPAAYSTAITLGAAALSIPKGQASYFGILGILAILAAGLLLILRTKPVGTKAHEPAQ